MVFAQKLTNLQMEPIWLYSYQIPDSQLVEIKDILAKYFADVASREMDKLWDEKKWDNETMENWANEHMK